MRLQQLAADLVAPSKGILAADESTGTIGKRFEAVGIESTEENRRRYRQMLFTAPDIEKYLSGIILYDETIRQETDQNLAFPSLLRQKGIVPGIKVDQGTEQMPDSARELVTNGLDGLAERLVVYKEMGARFAKWRAVIKIGEDMPTRECARENMDRLARYAKICQESGFVPIVEPEVLRDGDHDIEKCRQVTAEAQRMLFDLLKQNKVDLSALLLKPNMVTPGNGSTQKVNAEKVARETVTCLSSVVPPEVPGIVFLSGGQSEDQACENLNAMNRDYADLPWELSFSFGRALQNSAIKIWARHPSEPEKAQEVFLRRAELASAARRGIYV